MKLYMPTAGQSAIKDSLVNKQKPYIRIREEQGQLRAQGYFSPS